MYSSPGMYLKVISLKRAKYRKITLSPFLEMNNDLYIFDDYIFSLIKCVFFCLFNKKKNIEIIFCDGNVETLNFKIINFFFRNIKKSILWFNSLNEINNSKLIDFDHYNFFPEQRKFLNKSSKSILPFPKKIRLSNTNKDIFISYISEVSIEISDPSYSLINSYNSSIINKIDNFVYKILKENNFDIISKFEFCYDFTSELFNNLSHYEKININNEIYRLIKNRLRYNCVKSLNKHLKQDFCLIGKSWKKLGFETLRNNYDYFDNRNKYSSSIFSLDCGSTSGEYPIYLRTYEIVLNSSCLFQTMTSMSSQLFGDLTKEVCFNNLEDMMKKIETLRKLEKNDVENLKNKIFNQIKKNNLQSL